MFTIKNDKSFRVSAVPTLNSYSTTYKFEYWESGPKIDTAPIWAKLESHKQVLLAKNALGTKSGLHSLITEHLAIILVVGSAFILICVCCCIFKCCNKKDKNMGEDN